MATTGGFSWSQVVAKAAGMKVITPSRAKEGEATMSFSILYEHPDFQDQQLARKAAAIVRQALTPEAVLFSFPPNTFAHRTDAYKAIENQVGPLDGVRPLSLYDVRARGNLLIEAKFQTPEHMQEAIKTGVSVDGVIYKASPSVSGVENPLVRLQLNLLHNANGTALRDGLLASLRYYGKVYQIRQILCNGYFEGQLTVTLDPSVGYVDNKGNQQAAQPLQRMMYLEAWDTFTPASFKGADPICYYCRQAGHIRSTCPDLAKRVCFGCGERGHTKRFCRATDSELLDKYLDDTSRQNKAPTHVGEDDPDSSNNEITVTEEKAKTPVEKPMPRHQQVPVTTPVDDMEEDESITRDEDMLMVDAVIQKPSESRLPHTDPSTSVLASKHAPIHLATTMRVDTPEEMLSLSKVTAKTQLTNNKIRRSILNNTASASKTSGSNHAKTDITLTPVVPKPKGTKSKSTAHRAQ